MIDMDWIRKYYMGMVDTQYVNMYMEAMEKGDVELKEFLEYISVFRCDWYCVDEEERERRLFMIENRMPWRM